MRKATSWPAGARAGREPHGVEEPAHARKHLAREPGDPRPLQAAPPMQGRWSAAGSRKTHAADGRAWEVRQPRSTEEGPEQRPEAGHGGTGGEAAWQAALVTGHHAPDTEPGASGASRASRGDVGRVRQAAGRRPGCVPSLRKAGARRGSGARRDLLRGGSVMPVPTPIGPPPPVAAPALRAYALLPAATPRLRPAH